MASSCCGLLLLPPLLALALALALLALPHSPTPSVRHWHLMVAVVQAELVNALAARTAVASSSAGAPPKGHCWQGGKGVCAGAGRGSALPIAAAAAAAPPPPPPPSCSRSTG